MISAEPTGDEYAVTNFIPLPIPHFHTLSKAPNHPFSTWDPSCPWDAAPAWAERHSLRHPGFGVADCAGAGGEPWILPHNSERLRCLAGNHTPFRTSLNKGWVEQIRSGKCPVPWPSVLHRVNQGEPLKKVASDYGVSYETVRRVI